MISKRGAWQKNRPIFLFVVLAIFSIVAFLSASSGFNNPVVDGSNLTGTILLNCSFDTFDSSPFNLTNVTFWYVNGSAPQLIINLTNESGWNTGNFTFSLVTTTLGDGSYTIYCNATNATMGGVNLTRTVVIDNAAPSTATINTNSTANNTISTSQTLNVNITAVDATTGIKNVSLFIDG